MGSWVDAQMVMGVADWAPTVLWGGIVDVTASWVTLTIQTARH